MLSALCYAYKKMGLKGMDSHWSNPGAASLEVRFCCSITYLRLLPSVTVLLALLALAKPEIQETKFEGSLELSMSGLLKP